MLEVKFEVRSIILMVRTIRIDRKKIANLINQLETKKLYSMNFDMF